jgi:thioredoxin reductase (NADPH)
VAAVFLDASEPGVFVAGDVRHGSIKRVASAVGERAMAIALIHRFLSAPHGSTGRSE